MVVMTRLAEVVVVTKMVRMVVVTRAPLERRRCDVEENGTNDVSQKVVTERSQHNAI